MYKLYRNTYPPRQITRPNYKSIKVIVIHAIWHLRSLQSNYFLLCVIVAHVALVFEAVLPS